MSPIAVYRCEHRTTRSDSSTIKDTGIYAGCFIGHRDVDFRGVSKHAYSIPNPYQDGIGDFDDTKFVCGFTDPERLHYWFNKDFDRLQAAGFCVRVYLVPAAGVLWGENQCMFDATARVLGMDADDVGILPQQKTA